MRGFLISACGILLGGVAVQGCYPLTNDCNFTLTCKDGEGGQMGGGHPSGGSSTGGRTTGGQTGKGGSGGLSGTGGTPPVGSGGSGGTGGDSEVGATGGLPATGGFGALGGSPAGGGLGGSGGLSGSGGHTGGVGGGSGGGSGGGAPQCDSTKTPDQDACVIASDFGVFVSPTGSDTATGGRDAPLKTLKKAIEKAGTKAGKRVYACTPTPAVAFTEALELTTAANGVQIFGGFECAGWTYATTRKAVIESPSATGMKLTKVLGFGLTDVEVRAKDATAAGATNSVALWAVQSTGVNLRRVKLWARKGADGAPGTLPGYTNFPANLDGGNGTKPNGSGNDDGAGPGCSVSTVCPGGGAPGKGGKGGGAWAGGVGEVPPDPGMPGGDGLPTELSGGKGGSILECQGSTGGKPGATPATPNDGVGAAKVGSLSDTGWLPEPGAPGKPGQPGQGGGGGASVDYTGGGGGGACGGCGGAGALAGKGGGASIALLSFESGITLTQSDLVSSDGGAGGLGIAGQPGQTGGVNGKATEGNACNGGRGANGQDGGTSGSGAGGLSVGILYRGALPTQDSSTAITLGSPGAAGALVTGHPGTKGADGVAMKTREVPAS